MTIADGVARGKTALSRVPAGLWVAAIVLLSSSGSFGLGMLAERAGQGNGGVTILEGSAAAALTASAAEAASGPAPASAGVSAAVAAKASPAPAPAATGAPPAIAPGGQVVASKSGTKYYLPWCGTVKRIKEENKVWFESAEAAKAAGYEPAANCKGL